MRKIAFRAWDKKHKVMVTHLNARGLNLAGDDIVAYAPECEWMQFTGLLDKNGVEIYELMEINNKWRVEYHTKTASYVLTDISTGDIMPLHEYTQELEITGEYSPLPQDTKGSAD